MKKILFMMLALALSSSFATAQRLQQKLGRGVVAVYRSGGRSVTSEGGTNSSLISWRKLAQEPEGTTYNIYKRAAGTEAWTKMNSTPLKVTNYTPSSLTANTEYAVTAIINGVEGEMSEPFLYKTQAYPNVWFNFDYDNTVIKRNDYRTKFVWPMDLDGNGEYDAVVVDRLFAGAASGEEDTENTATTSHKIQAYKFDGTLLWTVDMGPNMNICAGQNDMVVAYDINCDGKCEVIIKSSDGTRFWDKANETWGKYVGGSDNADVDGDGIVDYRTQTSRNRPFYVSVIDGATGAEIAWNELKYSEVHDGSDTYTRTNRSSYMSDGYAAMDGHFSICYLDGIHPYLVMECLDRDNNKTHHNYVFTWGYDWNAGQASNWRHIKTWSRNDKSPWPAEFHQLRVADVDGDGCDEMLQGGYSVNPHTGWFKSPGIGHGDRFIVSDIDPDRPGLEVYAIQQSALLGQLIYDAATAERIKEWYLPSVYDVGRGSCMDIDPDHKGYEIWSYVDEYIYNCKGVSTGKTRSGSMFEGVWWDGRLQREWLNSPGGSGVGTNLMVTRVHGDRLCEFSQESNWATHANTGTRPAFMGDIKGDWREEVILAKQNESSSTGLVGYTTNMPTDYSIYCLQQDPHYHLDCTTRGYYQHPNTGFYLGEEMPLPPLPPVLEADLRYQSGAWTNGAGGFTSYDQTQPLAYTDGKSVMFDISASNTSVDITGEVKPSATFLINPLKKDFVLNGSIAGEGNVIKSQQGTVTIKGDLTTTGTTIVSEGTLVLEGSMAGALELRAKGTLAGNPVLNGAITFEGGLNYEGCRLAPGTADAPYGVMTFNKDLTLKGGVFMEMDLQTEGEAKCDRLQVNGNLTLQKTNTFTFVLAESVPAPGEYVLAECTGTLTANANNIQVRGLVGLKYAIDVREQQIVLVVAGTRDPALGVTWTGEVNGKWDYQTDNFVLQDEPSSFVAGDEVIFPEEATRRTVTLTDMMVTQGVYVNNTSGTYTFNGSNGGFSGEGDLVKNGTGNLMLNALASDYTGKTILNGGITTVKNLEMKGQPSCFGAGTAIQIGKATLTINHTNAATDRTITLTDTATINIPTGTATFQGVVTGTKGVLLKKGSGQLNLNYGGTNGFSAVILSAGTLSQGAWNATIGKSGATIDVTGNSTFKVFEQNSTTTVPNITNTFNIQQGKKLTFYAGSRCTLRGKLTGEGTVAMNFPYVRGEFYTDCAAFKGTLSVTGNQFRLRQNTDLSKATLELGSGLWTASFTSEKNEGSYTHKIGALSSTATDCTLSTGIWNVGYLGTNTTYAGVFNANATLNKYGDGVLALTGASAGPLNIYAGEVQANNTSASTTTGAVIVRLGGLLAGTGQVQNVTVQSGGTLGAGKTAAAVGTLTVNGNLTMNAGSTLRVRTHSTATKTSADAFKVKGNVKLTSPVIDLTEQLNENYTFVEDAELHIFTGDGTITITGDVTLLPEVPMPGYLWDTSALATEGIIRIVADPVGIHSIAASDLTDRDLVFDLAGRRVTTITHSGAYIVNGKKVYIKK